MFVEQYDICVTYVPGKMNVLANCFLRLPQMDGPLLGKNELKGTKIDFQTLGVPKDMEDVFIMFTKEVPKLLPSICSNKDVDIIDLFANLPAFSEMTCPLMVPNIQQHQAGDHTLVQTVLNHFANYPIKVLNRGDLVCYCENTNAVNHDDLKIYILQSLIQDIVRWYHMILGQTGTIRMYDTRQTRFFFRNVVGTLQRLCLSRQLFPFQAARQRVLKASF